MRARRARLFLLRDAVLLLTLGLSGFPIVYMLLTSFKTPIQTYDPSVWVFPPTLDNYASLFAGYSVLPYLINSIIVTTISVVVSLFLGSLAAYGLAKYSFRRRDFAAGWMLSIRFSPAIAGMIPLFLLAQIFHVFDTYLLLVLAYMTFNIPFATWMMRGFFEEIPGELEEAALVDGASRLQALRHVVLPLSGPGLFATAALLVIQTWNEFAYAFFLTSQNARTLPTITAQFQTVRGILWGEMTALGVLTTLPVIVFALLARRYLVRGLTFGAVKG
jgi:multiple sugar transport system permease protein